MPEVNMIISYRGKETPHPSVIFLELLKRANLQEKSYSKIAKSLGITRNSFYSFLNCKTGISPEMSVRLARFFFNFPGKDFENAGTPEFWWNINSKWLYYNSFNPQNPSAIRKIPVGKNRFIFKKDLNDFVFEEDKSYLQLDQNMQVDFEEISEQQQTHKAESSYSFDSDKFSGLMAAENNGEYKPL